MWIQSVNQLLYQRGWQISRKADPSSVAGEADCETFRERIGWSIFWKERPHSDITCPQSDRPYSDITCPHSDRPHSGRPHSDRPRIPIRKEGHWKSQSCTRSRKLSASLVIKKTFRHEDIQTWRFSDMKTFKHEDFQMWWPASKKATLLPEDPPPRRSSD